MWISLIILSSLFIIILTNKFTLIAAKTSSYRDGSSIYTTSQTEISNYQSNVSTSYQDRVEYGLASGVRTSEAGRPFQSVRMSEPG